MVLGQCCPSSIQLTIGALTLHGSPGNSYGSTIIAHIVFPWHPSTWRTIYRRRPGLSTGRLEPRIISQRRAQQTVLWKMPGSILQCRGSCCRGTYWCISWADCLWKLSAAVPQPAATGTRARSRHSWSVHVSSHRLGSLCTFPYRASACRRLSGCCGLSLSVIHSNNECIIEWSIGVARRHRNNVLKKNSPLPTLHFQITP